MAIARVFRTGSALFVDLRGRHGDGGEGLILAEKLDDETTERTQFATRE